MLSIKGIFRNGTAIPIEEVNGRENQAVIITFLDSEKVDSDKNDWEDLIRLIQNTAIETGISDLAHQHDHYLYGTEKKNE